MMKIYLCADTGATYTGARYLWHFLLPWIGEDGRMMEAVRWRMGSVTDKGLKRDLLEIIRGGGEPSGYLEKVMKLYTAELYGRKDVTESVRDRVLNNGGGKDMIKCYLGGVTEKKG